MLRKYISLALPLLAFCFILLLPSHYIPLPGITLVEQRVLAIFLFAALCWILEPIPIFATSVVIIALELLLISKSAIPFLKTGGDELGVLLSYEEILHTFASPIVILILAGFFLALAASKYRLDLNLARIFLMPLGSDPKILMLGIMVITGFFSMFMSNTATSAMMLSLLAPVLALFGKDDPARVGLVLSIPIAANIGGIGTPIGTPPNVIAMQYIQQIDPISFGTWMMFAVPFVIVMLLFCWVLLCLMFPFKQKSVTLVISSTFIKNWRAYVVYATFVLTIILWLLGDIHGMNSYVVAMIPIGIFTATGIIGKNELSLLSWDVLWLLSGGIALGIALDKSGLALRIVQNIPFSALLPILVLIGAMALSNFLSNFMSHTACTNLIMPVMTAMATSMTGIDFFGGPVGLLLGVTFASSLAMCLPISGAPNALVFATGMLQSKDMIKTGLCIAVTGCVLTIIMLMVLRTVRIIG